MKDIWILAHAQSQHHVDQVVGGWFDTGLTALGRRQGAAAAARLRDLLGGQAPTIVSSDLNGRPRPRRSCQALASPISVDPDLREMSYGSAGGRPQA